MVTTAVLSTVEAGRLAKAATALSEGLYSVQLVSVSEHEVRGFVKSETAEYGVTITSSRAFCSCRDSIFRSVVCKHGALLALVALRSHAHETKCDHNAPYGSVTGCQKCGAKHLHNMPALPPPNLKLAKVRRESYARSAAY
jgi:hypothetical protein